MYWEEDSSLKNDNYNPSNMFFFLYTLDCLRLYRLMAHCDFSYWLFNS